jgi:hypothetical protein
MTSVFPSSRFQVIIGSGSPKTTKENQADYYVCIEGLCRYGNQPFAAHVKVALLPSVTKTSWLVG